MSEFQPPDGGMNDGIPDIQDQIPAFPPPAGPPPPPYPAAPPPPYPGAQAGFAGPPPYPYNPGAQGGPGAPGGYYDPSGQGIPPGYPPPGYGMPGYGVPGYAQGYGYGGPPGTNGMSIAALICGICGFMCGIPGILGIIFGCVALGQIKQRGQSGRGMAIAGIVVGSSWLALIVLSVISHGAFWITGSQVGVFQ